MVIHELNNAARFADHMIGVKKGKVICQGSAEEVMTKENLKELFNIDAEIVQDPRNNKPVCLTYDMIIQETTMETKVLVKDELKEEKICKIYYFQKVLKIFINELYTLKAYNSFPFSIYQIYKKKYVEVMLKT